MKVLLTWKKKKIPNQSEKKTLISEMNQNKWDSI